MEKGFFKVFNPETSTKRVKIPNGYTNYKNGKLPKTVSFRDRFGNMWPIGVIKQGRNFYFQYGWEKFIEDNTIEFGDFLIFDYDGKGTFDFTLLGISGCEKKGVGGETKDKERIVEPRKSVESKGNTCAGDSSSSSSKDDSVEDYIVEELDAKEEVEKKNEEKTHRNAPRSKYRYVEEEEDGKEEGKGEEEETEDEEEEDEEGNERAGTYKKKAQRSQGQKATTCKVRNVPDHYGADIFKSGRATQPKNPYFVATIRENMRNQLYVPMDVVRTYKLELPPSMIIRDSAGREFETRVNKWNDGRIWLTGGWSSLCKLNLVEKNDRCIFEFVRGECSKGLYLQIQALHEGSSIHPNIKEKN